MTVYKPHSVIEQLQASEQRSLPQRCALMEEILRTVSSKELKSCFPSLLHEIFDFERNQRKGWELDCVNNTQNPDLFQRIRILLGPEGPLMKLINTLVADPYALYEFPIRCLPAPARRTIEEGAVPSFYLNKLQQTQSFTAAILTLNAFELYVFHLSHALVSAPWQERNQPWADLYQFLYPTLIDDMLAYYLPCNKSSLPATPQFASPGVRPPIASTSPVRGLGHPSMFASPAHPHQTSPPSSSHHRTLFKSSFINAQKQHQQNIPVLDQSEAETWRSETFLQVLVEFWLNQNSLSVLGDGFHSSSTFQVNPLYQRDTIWSMWNEHFLPTMNHVKMVRLLVKYLHHFANSATNIIAAPYQTSVISPLDQFKKCVIGHFLQKKLYTFLRHAFDRWPLDSCFRMVLETWLSYIQPWRYVDASKRMNTEVEATRHVEDKWESFVEDNLLFYSVLTSEFLPRVHRMDLTSPYSAFMVYRVSRILSLPNLASLIYSAEQKMFGPSGGHNVSDLGGSYLSSPHFSQPPPLPSQVIEFEGPNFHYPLFFSEATKRNFLVVIVQLTEALMGVRGQQADASAKVASQGQGFLASLFGGSSGGRDLYQTQEFKRLPVHLEQAIENFSGIFSIPVPATVSSSTTTASLSSSSSASLNSSIANESQYLADGDRLSPDCVETEHGLKLTNLGRAQIFNRERHFDKFDTGDPDLLPVRSYENATLVRLLFHFCVYVNAYFQEEFTSAFSRQSFTGHFSRMFLTRPVGLHQFQQADSYASSTTPHFIGQSHRPHLSLRFLAAYPTLIHLTVAYLACSFVFGLSLLGFSLTLTLVALSYGLVRASLRSLLTSKSPSASSSSSSVSSSS